MVSMRIVPVVDCKAMGAKGSTLYEAAYQSIAESCDVVWGSYRQTRHRKLTFVWIKEQFHFQH